MSVNNISVNETILLLMKQLYFKLNWITDISFISLILKSIMKIKEINLKTN